MMQWLHSQGCPWDDRTSSAAAKNGNADKLQWVIDQGCPEPIDDDDYLERKSELLDWPCKRVCIP